MDRTKVERQIIDAQSVKRRESDASARSVEQPCVVLEMRNLREFHTVLRTLTFAEAAVIKVYDLGVRVAVMDSQTLDAALLIKRQLFYMYQTVPGTSVQFGVNIKLLTACLATYAQDAQAHHSVRMTYAGTGHPLRLTGSLPGVDDASFECLIKTRAIDECERLYEFDRERVPAKIIFQGRFLRDFLSDLDKFAEEVTVEMGSDLYNQTPGAEMTLEGVEGTMRIAYSGPGLTSVEWLLPRSKAALTVLSFECETPVRHKYRAALLRKLRAASYRTMRTSMQMDSRGLLKVQCMYDMGDEQYSFCEFLIPPCVDVDESSVLER